MILSIVYVSATCKTTGTSLNDCLYVGPPFGQYIFDIILRFHVHTVTLAWDIGKALLMISIAKEDRDAFQFLWVNDPFENFPEVTTLIFKSSLWCFCQPIPIQTTIKHYIDQYHSASPQFIKQILNSIYVADVTYGSSDVSKTYDLYCWSKTKLIEFCD